ncbi:MAG: TonB family protein [Deltaproteobacteria bacterium]|nr:TonB family protein [Deltaproteobacteria bacterium]
MTVMFARRYFVTRQRLAGAATTLALILVAGGALAGGNDFWEEIAHPGQSTYRHFLRRGMRVEAQVERMTRGKRWKKVPPGLVTRLYGDALAAFQRALAARPEGGEALRHLGHILLRLGRYKEGMRVVTKAREVTAAARNDTELAFDMGIAYSKLGQFQKSVDEYDLYDRLARQARSRNTYGLATAHANAAEALMALGRLSESIQRYRASAALSRGSALTYWGLGVALDRDEQVSEALGAIRHASRFRSGLAVLRSSSVFFVPKGDIHYYLGLGHLAQGKRDAARKEFSLFLQALPKSPWAFRARDHLAELGKTAGTKRPKAKRLAPFPISSSRAIDRVAQDRRIYRDNVRSSYYLLRRCYRDALRGGKKISGTMRLRFTVSGTGRRVGYVKAAKILSSSVSHKGLRRCILKVIRRRYFGRPMSKQDVKMTVPIEFKQG